MLKILSQKATKGRETEEETSPAPVSTAASSSISHAFNRKQACQHVLYSSEYTQLSARSTLLKGLDLKSALPVRKSRLVLASVIFPLFQQFWTFPMSRFESQVHPSFISTFSRGFVGSGGGLRQVRPSF